MTLKTELRSPNTDHLLELSQKYIHKSLVEILQLALRILIDLNTWVNLKYGQIDSKPSIYLEKDQNDLLRLSIKMLTLKIRSKVSHQNIYTHWQLHIHQLIVKGI